VRTGRSVDAARLRRRVLRFGDPTSRWRILVTKNQRPCTSRAFFRIGFVVSAFVLTLTLSPVNPELRTYQLRYMATDWTCRVRGYGSRVLEQSERELRQLGVEQLLGERSRHRARFLRAHGLVDP